MSSQRYISENLRQKKKNVKKIKVYIFTIVIIAVLGVLVYILKIPQLQIVNTQIIGNSFVTTQEIQDKTDSILNTSYLWIIPARNIFLFPRALLENKIKENPAVISVRVSKNYFNKISITVVEQEKEALYCRTLEHSECYYVNKEGYIYSQVKDLVIPEQEIIMYLENEQKNNKEFIFDKELYINSMTFIKSSSRYGIPIGKVYLKSDGVLEFTTRDGTIILTSKYDDFEKDFSNFIALFDKNVLTKEQLSSIEYIDVRFGNKVFYKNKTN